MNVKSVWTRGALLATVGVGAGDDELKDRGSRSYTTYRLNSMCRPSCLGATHALDTRSAGDAAVRDRAGADMLELLTAEPEPEATKSVEPPVRVATFEC